MTSRRPGAPRSARRPVASSSGRRGPTTSAPRKPSTSRQAPGSRAPSSPRAGSASRGRGPAKASRPRSTATQHPPKDGAGITITRRTLVLVSLIVIALAALLPTVNSYVTQRQQLSELQAEVGQKQQQVDELQDQVARWEDPAYVAAQARERLLFAMPGETQYRLTDTSGREVPLTEAEQAAVEATEGEWFSTLWESVEGSSRLTAEDIPDPTDEDNAE
ncbi:septum formation initiator family protein [Brachybacterium muris]|uniref:FtsB family cell division protein n=1 Tax=Brachybacterium muris TaxID=219301 RepID=UPI00223C2A0F|nr:septum formation initiator family protein [Brachybacterium muris]MCT2177165.1 septum formation initiator family protein [Brachybacterium muris]